jgi:hypothetical protein
MWRRVCFTVNVNAELSSGILYLVRNTKYFLLLWNDVRIFYGKVISWGKVASVSDKTLLKLECEFLG